MPEDFYVRIVAVLVQDLLNLSHIVVVDYSDFRVYYFEQLLTICTNVDVLGR